MTRHTGTLILLLGAGLLGGCDNDASLASRGRVLDIANTTDETAEPRAVNDGAFVFTDTSERTDSLPINR